MKCNAIDAFGVAVFEATMLSERFRPRGAGAEAGAPHMAVCVICVIALHCTMVHCTMVHVPCVSCGRLLSGESQTWYMYHGTLYHGTHDPGNITARLITHTAGEAGGGRFFVFNF